MNHNELGELGEQLARDHLSRLGYEILNWNWRYRKYEVDIIARDKDEIVFVEVKIRSAGAMAEAHEFVGKTKQRNLISAADAYMISNELDENVRFDIIGILMLKQPKIEHFIDAFHT